MEPIRTDPITGAFNFLKTMTLENPYPDIQWTEKLENIIVDTTLPKDTMIFETGVNRVNIEGKWVIVEQYPDEQSAKVGHEKWIKIMREYPDYPLKDIDNWSLGEFIKEG